MNNEQTNTVQPEPNKDGKKIAKIVTIAVIITLLIGVGGAILVTVLYGNKVSKDKTTTTTTKTASFNDASKISTVDDFYNYVKDNTDESSSYQNIAVLDNSMTEIKLNLANNCTADGKKVELKFGDHKVEYTCKYNSDEDAYEAAGKVDGKYDVADSTGTTCGQSVYFVGEKSFISAYMACYRGGSEYSIYDEQANKVISSKLYEAIMYKDGKYDDSLEDGETRSLTPFIRENKFYVVEMTDELKNCNLRKYDLNNLSNQDTKLSEFQCNATINE